MSTRLKSQSPFDNAQSSLDGMKSPSPLDKTKLSSDGAQAPSLDTQKLLGVLEKVDAQLRATGEESDEELQKALVSMLQELMQGATLDDWKQLAKDIEKKAPSLLGRLFGSRTLFLSAAQDAARATQEARSGPPAKRRELRREDPQLRPELEEAPEPEAPQKPFNPTPMI